MSIELGNRLTKIRREAGFTQEEVAEKLGVSRQAVSRWENGEASPDTENLIALADLYKVSLDELVREEKKPEGEGRLAEEGEEFGNKEEDEDDDDDDDDRGSKRLPGAILGVMSLLSLVAYLLCGFLWKTENGGAVGWASMWVLLLVPTILHSIYRAFRDGKMHEFAMPPFCVAVYCGMGIIGNFYGQNFWHPYWIIFFAIPTYYIIAGFVDSIGKKD